MKPLLLFLVAFAVFRLPARGQDMPGPASGQSPAGASDPAAAPFASPPAAGHYAYLYRNAFWSTATSQWRPDSLRVQGRQTWVQTPAGLRIQFVHLAGYNFQTGDTSYSRHTYWAQGPWGYTDTLNRIFRTVGSGTTMREYMRDQVWAIPGGYARLEMEYSNGLDTSDMHYYYLDGLGRLVRSVHYGYGGIPTRRDSIPMVDSMFYQGNSPCPYRERTYTSQRVHETGPERVLGLWTDTDSIQYDAQGRRLYEATDSYARFNVSSGHTNIRHTYRGDTSETLTKVYGLTSANPPQPRPLVARWDVSIREADSNKHYFHNWNGTAFRLDYRRLAHFPTRGREFLELGEVIQTTDSLKNGVWKPYLGSETRFQTGTGGGLNRTVSRSWRGAGTITNMEKRDLEFYTDGLMDNKPKKKADSRQNHLALFTISPNPVRNILTLLSHDQITHVVLINPLGQTQTFMVEDQKVHLGHLPKGVYHINAFSRSKPLGTTRLVKE